MSQIIFVTGNQGKWDIAHSIFKEHQLSLVQDQIDTPEIQSLDVIDVASFSAEFVVNILQKPVLKSDVGYYVPALGGFPGPFIKYINQCLKPDDLLRLMHGITDRTVILKECLAFAAPNSQTITLVSEQKATIASEAEGTGSTFDQLLVLAGYTKPKGLYSAEEMFEYWKKHLGIYHEMAKIIASSNPMK